MKISEEYEKLSNELIERSTSIRNIGEFFCYFESALEFSRRSIEKMWNSGFDIETTAQMQNHFVHLYNPLFLGDPEKGGMGLGDKYPKYSELISRYLHLDSRGQRKFVNSLVESVNIEIVNEVAKITSTEEGLMLVCTSRLMGRSPIGFLRYQLKPGWTKVLHEDLNSLVEKYRYKPQGNFKNLINMPSIFMTSLYFRCGAYMLAYLHTGDEEFFRYYETEWQKICFFFTSPLSLVPKEGALVEFQGNLTFTGLVGYIQNSKFSEINSPLIQYSEIDDLAIVLPTPDISCFTHWRKPTQIARSEYLDDPLAVIKDYGYSGSESLEYKILEQTHTELLNLRNLYKQSDSISEDLVKVKNSYVDAALMGILAYQIDDISGAMTGAALSLLRDLIDEYRGRSKDQY